LVIEQDAHAKTRRREKERIAFLIFAIFAASRETKKYAALGALLIAIGAIRMATTFRIFSATNDEATHIAGGLELFEYHRYRILPENPPLPRVILAAVPWISGMRFDPRGTFSDQIHSVFYDHGDYRANLVRARVGTIVFFAIAAVALFFAARDSLGDGGALLALFLFTMEPVVLGYSALATHDGPAVAGLAVALLAFTRWLRRPDSWRALIFGAAFGFSIDCKFSSIVFVPAACVAISLIRLLRDDSLRRQFGRALATLIPAALVTLLVVWGGYGFTIGTFERLAPFKNALGPVAQSVLTHISPSVPLPAPPRPQARPGAPTQASPSQPLRRRARRVASRSPSAAATISAPHRPQA